MKALTKMKALSPVISVLLLVIIAAVASVMLYIWFSGYFASQAGKATEFSTVSITIKQATATNSTGDHDIVTVVVAIQNLANENINISSITLLVNGQQVTANTTIPKLPVTVAPGKTVVITVTANSGKSTDWFDYGEPVDITVYVQGTGASSGATYSDSASVTVYSR